MISGWAFSTSSGPKPSAAIFAPRMLCTRMSARPISDQSAALCAASFKSSTTDRLLRLEPRKTGPMPGLRAGPTCRTGSPAGDSTLMTSAPKSPSICAA